MRQQLGPGTPVGRCTVGSRRCPLPHGQWVAVSAAGDGLEWRFPTGTLRADTWLTADLLCDSTESVKLVLTLTEGAGGPEFRLSFGLLPQAQARMRFPLSATDQSHWMLPREGAWLKPLCGGAKVDLAKVDRVRLVVEATGDKPVRWCMTPLVVTDQEPPLLTTPLLPKGVLIDSLGQSAIRKWRGKSRSRDDVTRRLRRQLREAPQCAWPRGFSRWGGDLCHRVEPMGFFRTYHDGTRWWLVDPDGYLFWSAGIDCVRASIDTHAVGLRRALACPQAARHGKANFLAENFRRAFGRHWHERWAEITIAFLRSTGFNTFGNWSEWEIARNSGFPYVRPLYWPQSPRVPRLFRDMPDVFHPEFSAEAAAFAEQLACTADDPAFIGYFLMNEPTWGFAEQTPAEGMLYMTESCHTRREFSLWLQRKYGSDQALRDAWGGAVTLASVAAGRWKGRVPPGAQKDLEEFSSVMVEKLFATLNSACRQVDPHHLNLGARYYTVPPEWVARGMRGFDVFSINCYSERVRRDLAQVVSFMGVPALIGEWHFGALDAGLPASGIGRVRNQTARGRAYRVYLEDAASQPWCIGVHWFTLYDQSALGRGDGENYQIGFLDVCNRPYGPLVAAARLSHRRLYAVARGERRPFDRAPKYLPRLFY